MSATEEHNKKGFLFLQRLLRPVFAKGFPKTVLKTAEKNGIFTKNLPYQPENILSQVVVNQIIH